MTEDFGRRTTEQDPDWTKVSWDGITVTKKVKFAYTRFEVTATAEGYVFEKTDKIISIQGKKGFATKSFLKSEVDPDSIHQFR